MNKDTVPSANDSSSDVNISRSETPQKSLSQEEFLILKSGYEVYQQQVVLAVGKLLSLAQSSSKIEYQKALGRKAMNPRRWVVENLMGPDKLSAMEIAILPLNAFKHYDKRLHAALGQERHFAISSKGEHSVAEKIAERAITIDISEFL